MHRLTVQVNDQTFSRLEKLQAETSLPSLQAVLLSAFSQYRLDVKGDEPKKKPKVSPQSEKKLGSGNHPKNIEEVEEFFKGRVEESVRKGAARQFYDYYTASGWKQSNGNSLKNWGAALTQWLQRTPAWRPVDAKYAKTEVNLKEFLDWALNARPPVHNKYKSVRSIDEIDEHYIDEYRANNH